MSDNESSRNWTRRAALKTLGSLAVVGGVTGSVGIVSADHGNCSGYGGDHFRNGTTVDSYFSYATEYDKIYNNIKQWENSFVILSHSEWNGNIRIRFGEVSRASNTWIRDRWDHWVTNGYGTYELGDRFMMLCGSWSSDDHNLWNYEQHCGRLNDWRCVGSDAALKYWYHEVGHAHLMGHRDLSGEELMDPQDWYGMGLNNGETDHWYDIYSTPQGSCDGSTHDHPSAAAVPGGPGSRGHGHDHTHVHVENNGLDEMRSDEIERRRRNHKEIIPPTAIKVEPLE